MARPKTGDKSNDILRAAVKEVAAVGSSAVSINTIAKRADLAVGTLYRYYDNKDDILRAAYLTIKGTIHTAMMAGASGENTSKDKIRAMWFALLDYSHRHPQDFMFAEVIMNAALLSPNEQDKVDVMSNRAAAIIQAAIDDGTIRPAEISAITTLLIAPALQLGRQSALGGQPPDLAKAKELFTLCWRGVAA